MLLKYLDKIKKDKFLINSLVLFSGSLLVGAINYLYQFLMARMNTVEVYGELQALLAVLTITAVLTGTISTVLVKYTADFKATNQINKVYSLFLLFTKKTVAGGILFFLTFLIFSEYIARFLNLESTIPLLILSVAFFISFSSSVNLGIIRGLQKFKELSIISVISTILKLLFSVLLVKLGLAINGAIGAVTLASLVGYFVSFYPLKLLFKRKKKEEVQVKEIIKYSIPVFFTLLFTGLLSSLSIILVKHFFSAQVAGEFGALVILGNIIFFLTGPISSVMFPMASDAFKSLGNPAKVLKKALFLVIPIGLVMVLSYFLIPNFIINILVGSKFLAINKYLGWIGISMFLYSLVILFSNYFLSVGRIKGTYLVGVGAISQIILIFIFHSTLWQIIYILNIVMFVVLLLLIIYFIKIYYLCPKN